MKSLLKVVAVLGLFTSSLFAQTKIIGYLPYWAQYQQFYAQDIRYEFLTHVHYGYFVPTGDKLEFADVADQPNFQSLVQKATDKNVKVIGVVGGPGQAEAMKAATGESLSALAKNAASFAKMNGLSGLELDWLFTTEEDAGAFQSLVKAFKEALISVDPGMTLSATLMAGKEGQALYPTSVLEQLDYVTVAAIDEMTDQETTVKANCNGAALAAKLGELEGAGLDKSKIVVVVPFYGKSFAGATGLGSAFTGVGSGNEGLLNYVELMAKFDSPDYKVSYDEATQSEVAVSATETIVFNGIPSIKAVTENVKTKGYGGIAAYDLSGDAKQPIISLLVTIGKVLRPEINYKGKKK